MTDLVIRNARVMTCDPARPGLGMIDHGALVIAGGKIAWIGDDAEAPSAGYTIDARGRLVTPGLVDCHTHAIFAGDRANEFAMRAAGTPYLEIAAAGGGIHATLEPTRGAADDTLVELTRERIACARANGTTVIEIKSGYDLTNAGELRLLRCIARAAVVAGPRIVPTLLAHLIPADRAVDRDVYVRSICDQLVRAAATERLATSVDVYCDEGAFTLAETRAILTTAKACGLAVRGHVGQFRDLGAAELLGELGARSADHVEQISDDGIAALARAGVVAVMLPGACVQLRLPVPPVDKLRHAGVPLAVATDLNPGSSYSESLPLQLWLATTHYGMTVEEAWLGVTRHAARALGVEAGRLVTGAAGDVVLWKCNDPADVPYHYGANHVDRVWIAGVL
ncbi:MAG: imidazolonepropionase [Deltaproteobacteria bacterium]|nr:imidazolonepropionase [Deltaproteobacteria bacterium]